MKQLIIMALLLTALTSNAAILAISPNGVPVAGASFNTLGGANASAYTRFAVTSPLSATLSNISTASGSTFNHSLEVWPGGSIGNTTTFRLPTDFTAGDRTVFTGTGSVIASPGAKIEASWFAGTTDYGLTMSNALAAIRSGGGRVHMHLTPTTTATTAINATALNHGVIIEGDGASFDGEQTNPRLIFNHTSIGFDCTGSNNINFKDFAVDTGTSIPEVGWLLARNAAGSGAGGHAFTNIKINYGAKFSVAGVYSYASEENWFYGGIYNNSYSGAANFTFTTNNINSINSPFISISTGPRSNSTISMFGTETYNFGGANSVNFHLESVQDFHHYGGLVYNSNGTTSGGLANWYIDDTNAASNRVLIDGIRGESGGVGLDALYGIYLPGLSVETSSNISIINSQIQAKTSVVNGGVNATFYGLVYKNNIDVYGSGISVANMTYGDIDLGSSIFKAAVGGTVQNSTIKGNRLNITLSGMTTKTSIFDYGTGNYLSPQQEIIGSATAQGGVVKQSQEQIIPITASSSIVTNYIGAGAKITGVQFRVDSALATGNTWTATLTNGASGTLATAAAVAKNTQVNLMLSTPPVTTGTTAITIVPSGGGAFTAQGSIRAILYYETFENMLAAP